VIGVDPGLRTGCKCAAIDATGKYLGTITVYITQGEAQLAQGKEAFAAFVKEHQPRAIAVGNGTGGREAESFCKKALADAGIEGVVTVSVNEAGASVYSASDLAREEFPELDLTIRGAISIARRLQDPLAELVKIEPKSIGVGQYQHDVQEAMLAKRLGDVVESAVNHVGVELNTASAQLLGYVAGIGKSLAKKIVLHRDAHGAFSSRGQLQDVTGLGPKAFEQAAGFLRIRGAANPLDTSAVHPERYDLVEKMAGDVSTPLAELVGNAEIVDKIDLARYVGGDVGEPTLRDIIGELKKPGRDPRAEFAPPKFRDDVTSMEDLKPGMVFEGGIVTNVTAFGAFVDIGVHNDGLVHVSQLAEQFVKDPAEVVKVGQKLTVRVLEVDNARKRIALSAKRGGQSNRQAARQQGGEGQPQQQQGQGPGPGGNRRGGRGRGGGRGPRNDQQHAQGGQPHPQGQPMGDQPMGDQPMGDQPMGDQPQGEHAQGEQHAGDQAQGGGQPQPQGGDRRQWRERGPRNPQPSGEGAQAGGAEQSGSEQSGAEQS
ncbi:MAG: helix-hairpin-helix domain-containing protein, partial [Kofleriaceae bacterium]